MTDRLSDDGTRLVTNAPALAIAAYVGKREGNRWVGTHVGIFDDPRDAESWRTTGTPEPRKVYA